MTRVKRIRGFNIGGPESYNGRTEMKRGGKDYNEKSKIIALERMQ
jgi:hypothetical protein